MASATRSFNNKIIKRQRVMRYFIDAAREIAATEGISAINIRSVSNQAGYNSASLYNYFDNLDQLIAFTCIDIMSEWLQDLAKLSDADGDAIDRYLLGWKSFCLHSFAEPTAYAYVYSSRNRDSIIAYFDDYVQAFPSTYENIPKLIVEMFRAKTVEEQEKIMIAPCVADGFLTEETAARVYELAHVLHNGFLAYMTHPENQEEVDAAVARYMRYFASFVQLNLQKQKDLSAYTN